MTCSDHTTLDGGALRHAPLRLLDLESLCSGRSDQSDWLYQVRPRLTRKGVNFRRCGLLRFVDFAVTKTESAENGQNHTSKQRT